jgi:hypothetical protein
VLTLVLMYMYSFISTHGTYVLIVTVLMFKNTLLIFCTYKILFIEKIKSCVKLSDLEGMANTIFNTAYG